VIISEKNSHQLIGSVDIVTPRFTSFN
jgi:hypothetical protein